MTFRHLPLLLVFMTCSLTQAANSQPNIVFILGDDINSDSLGCYGGPNVNTPHIDTLAAEGMRFDHAYATIAMCASIRQEIYSGRSPWRTRTFLNHSHSVAGTRSIPHYLQPLGYKVGLIGKTHIGPKEAYPFDYLGDVSKKTDANPEIMEKARAYISQSVNEEKPFCLFIGSHDGHGPYTTGDASQYDSSKIEIPPYWIDTPELRRSLVQHYAEVTNLDALVGQMRQELESRGLWKNTLFIFCSEQGSSFPFAKWTCFNNGLKTGLVAHWPGRIAPGSTSDQLISLTDIAPTLVEAAGGRIQKGDFDGKSALKILEGKEAPLRQHVFGAYSNKGIIDNRDRIYPIRAIADQRYRLIYNPNHESITSNTTLTKGLEIFQGGAINPQGASIPESWARVRNDSVRNDDLFTKLYKRDEWVLYDHQKDPYELEDRSRSPEYKEIFESMKSRLLAHLDAHGDSDPIQTERDLTTNKAAKQNKKK